VVAVWGPAGAPGRTTIAVNLAAELARRGTPVVLADLDPYGGAVAQHLGILDEVSGLLSAARLAGPGQLGERFASVCRGIGDHLAVVTGLPRPDRWREVRPAHVDQLVDLARGRGDVVLDTGFCLEDEGASDFGGRPGRNATTLAALEQADEVVVVGAADPVGLARLARGLVDLRDLTSGAPVRVVVNRMRGSVGWSEKDIAGMVEGFSRVAGLHFLPDDPVGADRALVGGRPLAELGDSSLVRSVAALADAVFPASASQAPGRRGRRPRRR
jgi:MinD-like ATPase involved in chromosome partitioning or flagellar assembly